MKKSILVKVIIQVIDVFVYYLFFYFYMLLNLEEKVSVKFMCISFHAVHLFYHKNITSFILFFMNLSKIIKF